MRKAVTGHSSSIIGSPQVSKICVIMKQRKQKKKKKSLTAEEEKKTQWIFYKPIKNMPFQNGKNGIL